jgi:uncharacterized protein involved in exopolysaccharide biosynthesis
VSFSYGDPVVARDLASELVQLYLNENKRVREELAAETSAFLARQAAELAEVIAAKEAELAAFQREHAGAMPERSDLNLQLFDRTEREKLDNERDIRTLREKVDLLETELRQLSPYQTITDEKGDPVLSPYDRLKLLQREYLRLMAAYSPTHPDVLRTRREMEGLSAQTGQPALPRALLQVDLEAKRKEAEGLRERYSPDHPDVARAERAIANLQELIAQTPVNQPPRAPALQADNPVYLQKQSQLQGAQIELRAALDRSRDLQTRLNDFETRLTRTPEVEREYRELSRGYEELVAEYGNIQAKQREAELALSLESQAMGERFTLLEPPLLPRLPASPNRIAVLFLSLVIAFVAGVAVVAFAESSDSRVRGSRDVLELFEAPPLAFVPFIANTADVRALAMRRRALILGVVVWLAVIGFLILRPAANVAA